MSQNCTAKDFLDIPWLMIQNEFPQFLGEALFPLCLGATQQRPRQQAGAGQQRREQRGGGGRAPAPGWSPGSGNSPGVIWCQWHHLTPLLPQHRGGGGLCHWQDSHLGSPSRGKIYQEKNKHQKKYLLWRCCPPWGRCLHTCPASLGWWGPALSPSRDWVRWRCRSPHGSRHQQQQQQQQQVPNQVTFS